MVEYTKWGGLSKSVSGCLGWGEGVCSAVIWRLLDGTTQPTNQHKPQYTETIPHSQSSADWRSCLQCNFDTTLQKNEVQILKTCTIDAPDHLRVAILQVGPGNLLEWWLISRHQRAVLLEKIAPVEGSLNGIKPCWCHSPPQTYPAQTHPTTL